MNRQTLVLGAFAACMFAVPAFAAEGVPGMLNVTWGKNTFNFESMPAGVPAMRNLSRLPNGKANAGQQIGDYNNPILKPEAAAIVRAKGERARSGSGFPNSQDQCRILQPPFSSAMTLGLTMLTLKNGNILIATDRNANMRYIRINGSHPADVKPMPMGDSVGHWEGDTLVIDTIGIKVDQFTAIDRFGTPQSDRMHVVERYRLIDGPAAKARVDAFENAEGVVGGARDAGYDPDTSLKGLELQITMDDPKMLTAPWTVRVDYRRLKSEWLENVCADNPVEHYRDEWIGLPRADRADF